MPVVRFPEGFLWGAASASYQIEGSPLADGAGASIWHRFSHTPGTTHNADTGDIACDHYRRWQEDVDMMREMGLKGYRFSISWARILPEGKGVVNPAGLDFYDRLVDALVEAGIEPMITLYHWDLPGALQDLGGWANREIVNWFADYAQVVAGRLGDRVRLWATLNEPWVFTFLGYVYGHHAPGMRDLWAGFRAVHHALLAHGEAVARLRSVLPNSAQLGIVLNLAPQHPATDSEEDKAAAERVHTMNNALFVEPVLKGRYPALAEQLVDFAWPPIQSGDMERIAQPVDFIGVNYYSRGIVKHSQHGYLHAEGVENKEALHTEMGWEVYPEGLYEILQWVHSESTRVSIYVTENGAAFRDEVQDGRIPDEQRVEYLRQHFLSAHRAIQSGVPLKGYFVWSLMDNFEWAFGYSKRFGIVYVDYATQQRIWKDSARWYQQVIAQNGVEV
ncbi:MAG: GH1 family beta-glucosidase [Armatimonadota bacterium]